MLPAASRLTRSEDFARTIRRGSRAGRRTLVAHVLVGVDPPAPARAGLVVSKAVGGSVVRHRVSRQLRHLLRDQMDALPPGTLLVIRALPPSSTANHRQLSGDLADAVRAAVRRATGNGQTGPRVDATSAGPT